MNLSSMNYLVTFGLALFVIGSSFCRIARISMKGVQYRHVMPVLLAFVWGVGTAMSLAGGDKVDWFQPIGLLAICVYQWNTRRDWAAGMPRYFTQEARLRNAVVPLVALRKLKLENFAVGALAVLSIGAAAVGAAEGRGAPLQIFSVYADPPVTNAGKTVKIVYKFRRVRACPGYVTRFIIDQTTNQVAQHFVQTPTGSGAIGKEMEIPITLNLDLDLKPGRYVYKAVIYSNCEDKNYVTEVPLVPFVIAPEPQAN